MSSPSLEFALFATRLGHCGILWSERGIAGLQLPEGSQSGTRARLRARFPAARAGAPTPSVRSAIRAIDDLLARRPCDLEAITLDLDGVPPFHRRVYVVARAIAPGTTLTYREVAARLGEPDAARAVGQALARNPIPIIVPCHRVVASGGKPGGFSAPGGIVTKFRLLDLEGIRNQTLELFGISER
jgi:methylated-DNA-[protein]-cysteine S-methyltransferase